MDESRDTMEFLGIVVSILAAFILFEFFIHPTCWWAILAHKPAAQAQCEAEIIEKVGRRFFTLAPASDFVIRSPSGITGTAHVSQEYFDSHDVGDLIPGYVEAGNCYAAEDTGFHSGSKTEAVVLCLIEAGLLFFAVFVAWRRVLRHLSHPNHADSQLL